MWQLVQLSAHLAISKYFVAINSSECCDAVGLCKCFENEER